MEKLIQEMGYNNCSPTTRSSTDNKKSCVKEQDIIVMRHQSHGSFIYDESFEQEVARIYHENSIITGLSGD
eukprot:15328862-Ditylum_brightwellii.AAC.1